MVLWYYSGQTTRMTFITLLLTAHWKFSFSAEHQCPLQYLKNLLLLFLFHFSPRYSVTTTFELAGGVQSLQKWWILLSTWANVQGRKSISSLRELKGGPGWEEEHPEGGTAPAPQAVLLNVEPGTQQRCLMAVSTYRCHKQGEKQQASPQQC